MPMQRRSPEEKRAEFSLQNVSIGDTGNYSCVYYQTRAPFLASRPSDHLAIRVTGTTGIILIVIFIFLCLLACFLIYKYTRGGVHPDKKTKRCIGICEELFPRLGEPGLNSSMSSPAMGPESHNLFFLRAFPRLSTGMNTTFSDEGSQVSCTEEPHGTTYADLDTRALSQGPSSQMKQPLETCVYSAVKTQPGEDLEPGKNF
ncbi:T-cell-interacting; activating receptor on myeloid cells protein 1 [Camelus dromedarius]|uniref:T-cell-interacting n=1 Tax=Camelus dromedarius TaxID=9838 RepID=A0A5N4DV68_CAMDR|nr:T-cell-interacting; activating receptor on myeloid cells protein 1 [Camelus dromedarius]